MGGMESQSVGSVGSVGIRWHLGWHITRAGAWSLINKILLFYIICQ